MRRVTSRSDSGFTLIEVLAALLVFTIAITGLTHAGTQSAKAVTALDQKMLAGIVADNQIIETRRQLSTITRRGNETQMLRVFSYDVAVSKTKAKTLYRIVVNVRAESGEDNSQVLVTRTAFFRPQAEGGS